MLRPATATPTKGQCGRYGSADRHPTIDTRNHHSRKRSHNNCSARTTATRLSPRRVAAYLAKYVTKSLHDFGITARRLTAEAIGDLDVSEHVRAILSTIARTRRTHRGGRTFGGDRALAARWATAATSPPNPGTTRPQWAPCAPPAPFGPASRWPNIPGRQNDTQSARPGQHLTGAIAGRHEPIDTNEMLWGFDRAGHTSAGDRRSGHLSSLAPHRCPYRRYHRIPGVGARIPPASRGAG